MSGKAGKGIGKPSEKRRRSQAKTKAGQDEESKDKKNEMDEKDKPVVNFANRGKYGGNWDGTKKSDPEGLIQSYVLRVEEKNRLAESEWKKESASCFHADSLPDSQHIRSKKPRKPRRWQMRRSGRGRGGEWSKFDSSGSQTQGGMGSDRLLSLPERGEQEDRAGGEDMWVQELRPWQQRMDWFSQQQKENEKRLSLQHAQSAAPTRSSTGGMPRDAEAAGRCADWVQQLDEQPFVPARRRRYLKLEHTPKAPKPVVRRSCRSWCPSSTDRKWAASDEESLAVERLPSGGGAGSSGEAAFGLSCQPPSRFRRAGRGASIEDWRQHAVSAIRRLKGPHHLSWFVSSFDLLKHRRISPLRSLPAINGHESPAQAQQRPSRPGRVDLQVIAVQQE